MALERVSDIILLIFVSLSVLIYIVFILTVFINRTKNPFQSAFFKVCVSLGIANVITVLYAYLFVRAPSWGWFENFSATSGRCDSLLALFSSAVTIGMAVNQHLGVLLMAFNRFTAVVFSTKHEWIWSTRNSTTAIALQWILPVICVLPMALSQFEYDYHAKERAVRNGSRSVKFCDQNYETAYLVSGFVINLSVNAATCAMYIAVFIGAVRHSKRTAIVSSRSATSPAGNNNENSRNRTSHKSIGIPQQNANAVQTYVEAISSQTMRNRLELRLAVSGFLIFLSMLMYFLYIVLALIIGNAGFDSEMMYRIASDIFSCINPYALLLLSKQTRTAFICTLQCKKSS